MAKALALVEQAEAREEQAKAREEQAKARAEQAKAREEQARAQAEKAKARAEAAEQGLKTLLRRAPIETRAIDLPLLTSSPETVRADAQSSLDRLTDRQREILRLIAQGQNTKQIADLLKVSPKTVEYHRTKLMTGLNLRDVPGLVRFAIKTGLITPEQ